MMTLNYVIVLIKFYIDVDGEAVSWAVLQL